MQPSLPTDRAGGRPPAYASVGQADFGSEGQYGTRWSEQVRQSQVKLEEGQSEQVQRDLATVEQRIPRRINPTVERRLATLMDIRIPAVKVHTDQAADTVARRYRADAVTFGDNILFRAGQFDEQSATGLGLLAHEVYHAAQARLVEARNSAPGDTALEEVAAQRQEQRVWQRLVEKPAPQRDATLTPARPTQAMHPQSVPLPQTASVDRNLERPAQAAPALSEAQLKEIKDAVYRDLLDRIRTEHERGA